MRQAICVKPDFLPEAPVREATFTGNSGPVSVFFVSGENGARYLDPRTSRWLSADPAMGEYVPKTGQGPDKLPGMGGVFDPINLHCFAYAGNNPINLTDPDGEIKWKQLFLSILQTVGGGVETGAGILGAFPSAGSSTFAVVHGIYNVGDGFIGIVSAAKDREWGGTVFETSKAVLGKTTNLDENTVEAFSNAIAIGENLASMQITKGASLGKAIDLASNATSAVDLADKSANMVQSAQRNSQAQIVKPEQSNPAPSVPYSSNQGPPTGLYMGSSQQQNNRQSDTRQQQDQYLYRGPGGGM